MQQRSVQGALVYTTCDIALDSHWRLPKLFQVQKGLLKLEKQLC